MSLIPLLNDSIESTDACRCSNGSSSLHDDLNIVVIDNIVVRYVYSGHQYEQCLNILEAEKHKTWLRFIFDFSTGLPSALDYRKHQIQIKLLRVDGLCRTLGMRVLLVRPFQVETSLPFEIVAVDDTPISSVVTAYQPDNDESMSLDKKIKQAVKLIQTFSKHRDYTVAFSGGKDSVVLSWLTRMAGLQLRHFYNSTTIDPPGTIKFCEDYGCVINRPQMSFLQLVRKKGYPDMFRRFCCAFLKEQYVAPYIMLGVRRDESVKRKKNYCAFESTMKYDGKNTTKRLLPLLYFTDADIQSIVDNEHLKCHPLYYDEKGRFHVERRLGCIGCPLQGDRGVNDFRKYPKLLRQIAIAGNVFHTSHGRTVNDSYLNLVRILFYSNHKYERFLQTYHGLFPNSPKRFLEDFFNIELP